MGGHGNPARALGAAELARVFMWCRHVAMVAAALTEGDGAVAALRAHGVDSPLTSTLGPTGGDRYGPTQDAVLVFQLGEGWTEERPFAARANASWQACVIRTTLRVAYRASAFRTGVNPMRSERRAPTNVQAALRSPGYEPVYRCRQVEWASEEAVR